MIYSIWSKEFFSKIRICSYQRGCFTNSVARAWVSEGANTIAKSDSQDSLFRSFHSTSFLIAVSKAKAEISLQRWISGTSASWPKWYVNNHFDIIPPSEPIFPPKCDDGSVVPELPLINRESTRCYVLFLSFPIPFRIFRAFSTGIARAHLRWSISDDRVASWRCTAEIHQLLLTLQFVWHMHLHFSCAYLWTNITSPRTARRVLLSFTITWAKNWSPPVAKYFRISPTLNLLQATTTLPLLALFAKQNVFILLSNIPSR